jgi:cytochrome c
MTKTTLALLVALLPSISYAEGDAAAGEKSFKKCASCHSVDEGGKNGNGPNLYGISTRGVAANADYKYSAALTEFAATNSLWTDELLDAWLADPKKLVSGTKMNVKVAKEEERANLIAYLKTLGSQ